MLEEQPPKEPSPEEAWLKRVQSTREQKWAFLDKLDWKLLLPAGMIMLYYSVRFGTYPSLLGYIGVVCSELGMINFGAQVIFRNPLSSIDGLPTKTRYHYGQRSYIEFWILICVVALIALSFLS